MSYYEIFLPLPTSINSAHQVGREFFCKKTKKRRRVVVRSDDYQGWVDAAGVAWRDQFPGGVAKIFTGRLRVDYVFVWPINDPAGLSSDIGNREKVLSDFLQKKFFPNDNQIDEQRQYRNLWGGQRPYVIVRVSEIKDTRCTDPMKRFENWD